MKRIYTLRLEEETIDDLQVEAVRLKMNPTSLARKIVENYFKITIRDVAPHIRDDAPGLKNI